MDPTESEPTLELCIDTDTELMQITLSTCSMECTLNFHYEADEVVTQSANVMSHGDGLQFVFSCSFDVDFIDGVVISSGDGELEGTFNSSYSLSIKDTDGRLLSALKQIGYH
jgi:hypothetical protein